MKLFKSVCELNRETNENLFVTIGNFDGVHRGHQHILKNIGKLAKDYKAKVLVITFCPHPVAILKECAFSYLLTSYSKKRELLKGLSVDYLLEVEFSKELSLYTPEMFLNEYITSITKLNKIFIGYDFNFGKNKSGDFNFIREYFKNRLVEVIQLDVFEGEKEMCSTTIRNLLKSGKIEMANELLGRKFDFEGIVQRGAGRGNKLGIPTCNLDWPLERTRPESGVYITQTTVADTTYSSVSNIGHNPTVSSDSKVKFETHILDFNSDIYDGPIKVEFLKKLRNEKKFNSLDDLVSQIKTDIEDTRSYFDGH